MLVLKTNQEIEKIRKSCQLVAEFLQLVIDIIECEGVGFTTLELDNIATLFAKNKGAIPAFKGFEGFPYSICASKNSEIVHGIPTNEPLRKGDILSVDFGILLDGYYGDSAITIPVGKISKEAKLLIKTGQECLYKSINKLREGVRLNQISYTIQQHAESKGYHVIRSFVGHGIGKELHEDPQVPNFTKKPDEGLILKKGTVIAIEPMIAVGTHRLKTDKNGWTIRTEDGSLSAHWEHTVAITDKGPEILSLRKDEEWSVKTCS